MGAVKGDPGWGHQWWQGGLQGGLVAGDLAPSFQSVLILDHRCNIMMQVQLGMFNPQFGSVPRSQHTADQPWKSGYWKS